MGLFLVLMGRLSPTTLPVFISTERLAAVRAVQPLDCVIECSNAIKWNPHKILGMLKKKNTKIDAFKPLKLRNHFGKLCIHVWSSRIDDDRFHDDHVHQQHVYIICRENFSSLGLPVNQFTCFFFLTSLKFHAEFIF